ncbi:MAG: hypothetical protein R3D51_14155 [Hyphomicrobiaceae bacterium]
MRRALAAVAGLFAGYLLGAGAGALLVDALSSNTHDKSVETVMTAAFVTGPLGAALGIAVALWMSRRPRNGGRS